MLISGNLVYLACLGKSTVRLKSHGLEILTAGRRHNDVAPSMLDVHILRADDEATRTRTPGEAARTFGNPSRRQQVSVAVLKFC
ncbi:hypothetical protein Zmor_019297 [Zophobas morio]|uniref:Uncharacterized protein n=1 Tax=Zophobas morio TaxID=2755281 RepID=A0AA38I1G0_9CUCU|nr:hypothetical protein Zmor_019297 [Zophobas morio]